MNGETCRSCKALVVWALTREGNRIPVNPNPVANGNLRLEQRGAVLVAEVADLFSPPGDRYATHFVDCPDAKTWRK